MRKATGPLFEEIASFENLWRRFRRKLGARWHDLERGLIQPEELAASAAAMIAHLERAGSRALRRREMRIAEV